MVWKCAVNVGKYTMNVRSHGIPMLRVEANIPMFFSVKRWRGLENDGGLDDDTTPMDFLGGTQYSYL